MSNEIPVQIRGLVPTPTGVGVFLGENGKTIAIFVDQAVGMAISLSLRKIKPPRPLTHDLLANIFAGLGVRVQKVVVNDLKDDTFFARLFLIQENELGRNMLEIDARPSDSIAIALQHGCPIFVARHVWEKAQDMTWALEQAQAKEEKPENDAGPDE
jgi:bifunctional DNase/RNase